MTMRVFLLAHTPRIGEVTLAIGDPWTGHDRSLSVVVNVHGIGQGADGDRTMADGYAALAAKVREFADELDAEARRFAERAKGADHGDS